MIPPKAIPPARDRLQSRLIVWIGIAVLCYLTYTTTRWFIPMNGQFISYLGRYDYSLKMAFAISAFFALAAWRLKTATPLAAACGGMICLLITEYSHAGYASSDLHSGLTPLILLFILTFEATRLGRARKIVSGLAESSNGRTTPQIIANLGIAAVFSSSWGYYPLYRIGGFFGEWAGDNPGHYFALMYLPMLAALAEATADTVSSEIGQAFGGTPFMLTTLRRVPPGTDGAISLYGTLAGIAAAAVIAITGAPALGMSYAECAVAFIAGIGGLFFDSLLGATLEHKGWLGNDLVNFTSTAFAAALSLLAIRFGQSYLMLH